MPQGKSAFAINRWADAQYFGAMGIPILRGRSFDQGKRLDAADEAVISESFAKQFFPGEDPIGKHIRHSRLSIARRMVVGIVGDIALCHWRSPLPMMYFPLDAGVETVGTLIVRSSQDVEQFALPIERIVAGDGQRSPCLRRAHNESAAG